MIQTPNKQILIPSLHPDGNLQLEFHKSQLKLDETLNSLVSQFKTNPTKALFNLGLISKDLKDSSWNFWRIFSLEFIDKLRLSPDLEILRDKIEIN